MKHSAEYEAYLCSPQWQATRAAALKRAGHRCERCGQRFVLQVHHRTYVRLGRELPGDLEVLCAPCHVQADAERKAQTAAGRWDARIDGFARRVYGSSWQDIRTRRQVERELRSWLRRLGEHVP